MYHIQYLDKKTIDYFNHKLDRCIKDKYRYSENRVQTVNGFQTPNISNDVSIKIKKQLLKNIFKPSDISHLHLIRYNKGGRQELHTHSNEVYSFILYLDRTIFEKPKKGKIIFFNAKIPHKAKISYKNKRVLVGALKPVV